MTALQAGPGWSGPQSFERQSFCYDVDATWLLGICPAKQRWRRGRVYRPLKFHMGKFGARPPAPQVSPSLTSVHTIVNPMTILGVMVSTKKSLLTTQFWHPDWNTLLASQDWKRRGWISRAKGNGASLYGVIWRGMYWSHSKQWSKKSHHGKLVSACFNMFQHNSTSYSNILKYPLGIKDDVLELLEHPPFRSI